MYTDRRAGFGIAAPRGARCWLAPALLILLCSVAGCAGEGSELTSAIVAQQTTEPASVQSALQCGELESTNPKRLVRDLGHDGSLASVVRSGDRVVGKDVGRWILWDPATRRQVANGPVPRAWRTLAGSSVGRRFADVDLVRNTLITPGDSRLEVRSARDGSLLTEIPLGDEDVLRSGIAKDESYVFVATGTMLRMSDRSGRLLNELQQAFWWVEQTLVSERLLRTLVRGSADCGM